MHEKVQKNAEERRKEKKKKTREKRKTRLHNLFVFVSFFFFVGNLEQTDHLRCILKEPRIKRAHFQYFV